MAADLSKSVFDLFSGRKRTRMLPTLGIAMLVTAIVAIPLTIRAIDARDDPAPLAPGDARLVLVDTVEDDPFPLDSATVQGPILISVTDSAANAVSFNLFEAGDDQPLITSQDLDGPQFDLVESDGGGGLPLDSTLLPNGDYELFLTISTPGEDQRTAVTFRVVNS